MVWLTLTIISIALALLGWGWIIIGLKDRHKKMLKVVSVVILIAAILSPSIIIIDYDDTDITYYNNWYYEMCAVEEEVNLVRMSENWFKLLANETINTINITFHYERVGVFNQGDVAFYPLKILEVGEYTDNENITYEIIGKTAWGDYDVSYDSYSVIIGLKGPVHRISENNFTINIKININKMMIENMELYDCAYLRLYVTLPESPQYCRSDYLCSQEVEIFDINVMRYTDE